MNYVQGLIDGMSAVMRANRAKTQLTLGGMIAALKEMPDTILMRGLKRPHSYRGYYSDLAFEESESLQTPQEMLVIVQDCLFREFTGYKGGEFKMLADTPVWISNYGCCGSRIMAIQPDGAIVTATEPYE